MNVFIQQLYYFKTKKYRVLRRSVMGRIFSSRSIARKIEDELCEGNRIDSNHHTLKKWRQRIPQRYPKFLSQPKYL